MNSLLLLPWIAASAAKDPVPTASEVKPGWVLSVVVVTLILVSVGLWWNMRSRIRRVHVGDEELADKAQGERPAGHQDGPPGRPEQHDGHVDGESGGSHPV